MMAEETTTTKQPENDNANGGGDGQPGQSAPATFTQEQLDTILKDRLARATTKATTDLLGELGIEDVATAKQTLVDAKTAHEAQMSELEKANAQITEANARTAEAEIKAEAIKAQAAEALLKAAIISQAGNFNDPNDAWSFVDKSKIEAQEDGSYKGIDEALKGLIEAKPYLVKAEGSSGPGTPTRPKGQTIMEKLLENQKKTEAGEKRPSTVRM